MNVEESTSSEVKSESRLQEFVRGAWRWVLVAVLAFGLGALLTAMTLYIPTRQKLNRANTDLERANTTLTSKTDQITTLQTGAQNLQNSLDSATLHRDVLKALSGVRGASLAVTADDYAGARLSLIQATEALDALSGRLGTEQKDVFTAMQQSAAQALADVQTDLKSAQAELDQLARNLVQLEDNLFPHP